MLKNDELPEITDDQMNERLSSAREYTGSS